MAKTKAAKAYSYLRFSTPEQAAGDSFRRQSEMAARYAEQYGLELDTELTFRDLGVSAYRGLNAETGALRAFLQAVEEGAVTPGSVLLVESLDRISRRTARKAVRVLEEIVEAGVDVVTLQDGKRYSVESLDGLDFIMAVLILIRGHEESLTKSKRVHEAWKNKRNSAADQPLTTRAPGWIHVEKTGPREWSKPELIPDRAAIVHRIFDSFLAGEGKEAIAKKLNAEKVPPFGSAKYWHRSYVQKILSNPAVVGAYVPHEFQDGKRVPLEPVRDYFPKAVTVETWKRAQALMKSSGKTKARKGAVQNLLAGLAKCPKCGGTMTRVMKGSGSKAGKPKLVCAAAKSGARDFDGSQFCSYTTVPLDTVEDAIVRAADGIRKAVPARDPDLQQSIDELQWLWHNASEELDGLLTALAHNPESKAINSKVRKLEAQCEEMRAEVAELEARAAQSDSKLVRNRAERLAKALAEPLDKAAANAAIRECFRGITVDYGRGELRCKWRHTDQEMTVIYDAGFEALPA